MGIYVWERETIIPLSLILIVSLWTVELAMRFWEHIKCSVRYVPVIWGLKRTMVITNLTAILPLRMLVMRACSIILSSIVGYAGIVSG